MNAKPQTHWYFFSPNKPTHNIAGKLIICPGITEDGFYEVQFVQELADRIIAKRYVSDVPMHTMADWIRHGAIQLPAGVTLGEPIQRFVMGLSVGVYDTITDGTYTQWIPNDVEPVEKFDVGYWLNELKKGPEKAQAKADWETAKAEKASAQAWRESVWADRATFDPTQLAVLVEGMNVEIRTVCWARVFDGPDGHMATATTEMWVIEGVEYPQIHGVNAEAAKAAGAVSVTVNTEFWRSEPVAQFSKEPIR